MTSPRITAIVLVLNEADNLRALLPQLSWADETLVIDGGSTDVAEVVAGRHGGDRVWCGGVHGWLLQVRKMVGQVGLCP